MTHSFKSDHKLTVFGKLGACLSVIVLLQAGCARQDWGSDGRRTELHLEWRSDSPEQIWVDQVSGLGVNPRCGNLGGPTGSVIKTIPLSVIPQETTLIWWDGDSSNRDDARVQHASVAIPPEEDHGNRSLLVLTFRPDGVWTAAWETLPEFDIEAPIFQSAPASRQ